MSLASLEAFLECALAEPELRDRLGEAPDAAAVAAIARAAGFAVSERDLWQATAASPDDLPAAAESSRPEDGSEVVNPAEAAASAPATPEASPLPDPWFPEEPLTRFVHQAQGDAALREALTTAPDAAAVASIAQAAGYPVSAVDLWLASGTTPDELAASLRPPAPVSLEELEPMAPDPSPAAPPAAPEASAAPAAPEGSAAPAAPAADSFFASPSSELQASVEEAIRTLLAQAAEDAELRQALASAPDAAAVASIAREAGHPIDELTLWLASGAAFEEVQPEPEPPSLDSDPLSLFLRAVEVDPDLQLALASAPDAATVAAIARIAGFPLSTADLWAASHASPRELELEVRVLEELVVEQMVVVEC